MTTVTQKLSRLKIFTVISFFVTSILGTLFHFAFDFLGQNPLVAPFFPVNESTWEHLKLLFFPFLIMLITGWFCGIAYGNAAASDNHNNRKMFLSCYLDGAAFGEICGMAAIIIIFYSVNGILGSTPDPVNIAIYYISTAYAHFTFYKYASQPYFNTFSYHHLKRPVPVFMPLCVFVIFIVLFAVFTFYPPHIGLFVDPKSLDYGLSVSLFNKYSYPSSMMALWSDAKRFVCFVV